MRKLPKILQIFLYVVYGVLILFIGLSFFATPIVQWYLEKQVKEVGKGQYTLQFTDLNLSLLQGKVYLSGIRMATDSAKAGTDPIVEFQVEELLMGGFAYLDFLLKDELNLNRLGLKGGSINIKITSPQDKQKPEQPFKLQQLDIYPKIKGQFEQLSVGTISLEDLEVQILQEEGSQRIRYQGRLANFRSKSFLMEDNSLITESRSFYAESHELILTDQRIWLEDAAYQTEIHLDTLSLQSEENILSFYLTPGYFLKKESGKPDTTLFANSGAFELKNLDLFQLQENKLANIEGITLSQFRYYQSSFQPDQAVSVKQEKDEVEAFNIKEMSLGQYLPDFVERVRLEELNVENMVFELTGSFAFEEGFLRAKEVVIDEESAFAKDKFLHSSQLQAELHQIDFTNHDSPHRLSLSSFLLETENGKGRLEFNELGIQPVGEKRLDSSLDAEVGLIAFQGFDTRNLPAGILRLEKLSIQNSNANLRIYKPLFKQSQKEKKEPEAFNLEKLDLYPQIRDQLERISIKGLHLNNLSGSIQIQNEQNVKRFSARALQLESEDFLIAADELFTENRTFYSGKTSLEGHQIQVSSSGRENWQVKAKLFELNSQKEQLFVSSQSGSFLHTGEQKTDTLLFFGLDQIDVSNLQLHQLQKKRTASIQGFSLTGVEFVTEDSLLQKSNSSGSRLPSQATESFSEFSLGENLPQFIDEIYLEDFNIEIKKGRGTEFSLKEGKALAKGLTLNKEPAFAEERFLHFISVDTKVEQLELEGGNPLHQLNLSSFFLNVNNGVGEFSSQLTIKPKGITNRFKNWLEAEVPLLEVRHIDTRGISAGNFSLDTLLIKNPKMVWHTADNYGQKEEKREDTVGLDLYPLLGEKLERATVKSLQVREGDIRLSGIGGSYYGIHVPEISAEVSDIELAKNTAFTNNRILHALAIWVSMNDLLYLLPDNVYRLQLDELHLDTREKNMEIEGLYYGYSENYEKKLDGEKKNELYRIRNKSLKAEEVEWKQLLQKGAFIVDKITSENLDLHVYKDLNKPESGQTKPLPNEMVAELGIPIFIDTLAMQDMEVRYEEKAEGAEIPGLVDITDMEVLIQNITNIERKVAQNPEMRMMGNGRVMGKGYFETTITVPLQENGKNIQIAGSMDTLNFTELNRITRFNSRIAAESGTLYKVRWDFEVGPETAAGKFEVSYEDLKVQLSSSDSPDTTGVLKDVGSYIANLFVVNSSIAEGKSEEPKEVEFEQERDKERSFFNYYVKSLLAGLMVAIGVPFQ